MTTLTIKPEYEKLVPPLSDKDYEELKESLKNDGQFFPITINEKGEILDGHHRFRACNELGIEPKVQTKHFDDPLDEKLFVIDSNLKRRHLQIHERALLADERQKIEAEKAKQRQRNAGLEIGSQNLPSLPKHLGNSTPRKDTRQNRKQVRKKLDTETKKKKKEKTSRQRAAKDSHLSDESLRKYQYVLKNEYSTELVDQMKKGWITINKAYKKLKRLEKKEELKSIKPTIDLPENCNLILGDFTEQTADSIPDNSIDLIFTDPPYGYDSLPIYKQLSVFANRVLKPGGSLVFFVGQLTLNEIFIIFDSAEDLKYWWILAVKHTGAKQRIHPRSVFAEWKPLLWYVKGEKPTNLLDTMWDHIESRPPEKINHEWEQSVVEAEHVIKYLTVENQIVLDPMMGSGTTGIATLNLKRNFIGIEKEQERFQIGKNRIGNKKFKL